MIGTVSETPEAIDKIISFQDWLRETLANHPDKKYRHRRMDEVEELRSAILPQLRGVVREAHADAIRALQNPRRISLDQLRSPDMPAMEDLYPQALPIKTLMGYFGEVLAGVLCEYFSPMDETRWKVPAYLFGLHRHAFRYLERIRQVGKPKDPKHDQIYGRAGDDCLAFVLDREGKIVRSIVCEAKCLSKHNSNVLRDAHEKLNHEEGIPEDRIQVIAVLEERQRQMGEDPEITQWINALYELEFQVSSEYERCDLVCYICGNAPKIRPSWIDCQKPHSIYRGRRALEAIEVYLPNVQQLVRVVYGKEVDESEI